MESSLTKRRPSLIPESPDSRLGWSPAFDALEEYSDDEDENGFHQHYPATTLSFLPTIKSYDTNPFLTIRKFQYLNSSTGQLVNTSMAHTHGVCVLNTEEEQIIACDHYNNRLLMFDSNTDGRLLEVFRGDLSTPECVAPRPNHRQQIYVTKPHSISLYDLEKKMFIYKLGADTDGHANNRFNSPGGLAVDPDNGEAYMCDRWNNRVCVFSPDFRYVNRRWYLSRWEQNHYKVKPNFVAVNNQNQCVVTCEDAPNYRGGVYFFDKMGYIQKIYDHYSRNVPPNVEARLHIPHGILLDNQGNWLTMSYSDDELSAVENRAKSGEDDDKETISYWKCKILSGPSALAIKRDQTLVIGDRDNNAIFLFKQKPTTKDDSTPETT